MRLFHISSRPWSHSLNNVLQCHGRGISRFQKLLLHGVIWLLSGHFSHLVVNYLSFQLHSVHLAFLSSSLNFILKSLNWGILSALSLSPEKQTGVCNRIEVILLSQSDLKLYDKKLHRITKLFFFVKLPD